MPDPKPSVKPKTRGATLVFQDPRDPDFFAWQGPTVADLVKAATAPNPEEMEEFKAITIRPTVQEVALLDELAGVFGQSRNVAARQLLVAAMREALSALPDERRRKVQGQAFKRLGWGVMTPEKIKEVNERGARGEGTPLSELCKPPEWLDDEPNKGNEGEGKA